jgi:hypothetical protein
MSAFTQDKNPVGRYLDNGNDYELLENLIYHVGAEGSGEVIVVPEGSVTDWASIPFIVQALIPKSIGKRAAVVHDYLYKTNGLGGLYTRKRCDEIFREALIVLGVPKRTVMELYWGVRVGGWKPWLKYAEQLQLQHQQNEDRPDY